MIVQWSLTQQTSPSIFKLQLSWLKSSVFKVVILTSILNTSLYFVATTLLSQRSSPMSEVLFSIDQFEAGWALLELDTEPVVYINFPRSLLPKEAEEGNILVFQRFESGAVYMKFDRQEERRRRKQIERQWNSLKKGPAGDIDL